MEKKKYLLGAIIVVIGLCYTLFDSKYNPFRKKVPIEIGQMVTAEQFSALKKSPDNDAKRVAFVGRGSVSSAGITMRIGHPYSMAFSDTSGKLNEHVDIELGKSKNTFYIPEKYIPSDLLLYDNEGKPHKFDENVIVSFTMRQNKSARPQQNPNTGEYSWDYEDIRIDPVTK